MVSGFDHLPIGHLLRTPPRQPVNDDGRYRRALDAGRPDQRRMFTAVDGTTVTWPDGTREHVDTILLATGYRPELSYLDPAERAVCPPSIQDSATSSVASALDERVLLNHH